MQFSEIPGLQSIKQRLIQSYLNGKVAHALLFSGVEGSANLALALAYITYLFCENKEEDDSCGSCSNCVRTGKYIHPDVHLFFPKTSATDSKYEKQTADFLVQFRSFLIENPFGSLENWAKRGNQENKNLIITREDSRHIFKNVSMQSVESGYKVILVWLPELMNSSSSNAILKILEEPPKKTLFFLVTNHYDQLLATITSRSQLVLVPPSDTDEITSFLQERGLETERATLLASLSEGKPGRALEMTQEEDVTPYEDFQLWMRECWGHDYLALVKRSEDFAKSGKSFQRSNLSYALMLVRESLSYLGGREIRRLNPKQEEFIHKFSQQVGIVKLEKNYQLINKAIADNDRNANPRINHLNLSLAISQNLK